MTYWTPDRDAILRKLWLAGKTGRQCGEALGISRNAAIARCHRLKLYRPKKPAAVKSPRRARRRAAKPAASPAATINAKPATQLNGHTVVQPVSRQGGHAVGQVGARRVGITPIRSCAWPIGDPKDKAFRFCGAEPVVLGRPYCAEHCRQAYRAPEPKAAETEAA